MSKTPDAIDELVKEIMTQHHIALGRDDPVLILHTVNTRLLNDSQKALNQQIEQAQQQWQDMTNRWGQATQDRAERILNAALTSSKEVMTVVGQECATATHNTVEALLEQAHQHLRRTQRLFMMTFMATAFTLLACGVIMWLNF